MKSSRRAGKPPVPPLASMRMVHPVVFQQRGATRMEDVSAKEDTFATRQANVFCQTNVQVQKKYKKKSKKIKGLFWKLTVQCSGTEA